jgi:predicted transcriptional regulator
VHNIPANKHCSLTFSIVIELCSVFQQFIPQCQNNSQKIPLILDEAMLARFFRDLNKDIQHILYYKEYNPITRLFHLALQS